MSAGRLAWVAVLTGVYLLSLGSLDPLDADAPARTRFFGPNVGIAEEPASGSAAGPLAAYLVAYGLASGRRPVIIEQGHSMGRPSRIEEEVELSQRSQVTRPLSTMALSLP